MGLISSASEVNTLAEAVPDTGGVYFVTAFTGLLAPYWDPNATGLLIGTLIIGYTSDDMLMYALNAGISQGTSPRHLARAILEANAFQTRAVLESMKLDSNTDLKCLKVDGGMTNGDFAMTLLADIGGFSVIRPEMREYVAALYLTISNYQLTLSSERSTALGSALLAGSAVHLFGWDVTKPETLQNVNMRDSREFKSHMVEHERQQKWEGWQRAIERSKGWEKASSTH